MPICKKCKTEYQGDEKRPCPNCGAFPDPSSYMADKPASPKPEPQPTTTPPGPQVGASAPADGAPVRKCGSCGATYAGRPSDPCPKCGEIDIQLGPHLHCHMCDVDFMGRPGDPCPKCGLATGAPPGLPWQRREKEQIGPVSALWKTIVAVQSNPDQAWAETQLDRGWREPIFYMVIIAVAVQFVTVFTGVLIQAQLGAFMRIAGAPNMPAAMGRGWAVQIGIGLAFLPVQVALNVLFARLTAALNDALMPSFGGPKLGSHVPFYTYAYGTYSAMVWAVIPIIGPVIAFVVGIIVRMKGLSIFYGVSKGKALAVMFFSWFVLIFIFGIITAGVTAAFAGILALLL